MSHQLSNRNNLPYNHTNDCAVGFITLTKGLNRYKPNERSTNNGRFTFDTSPVGLMTRLETKLVLLHQVKVGLYSLLHRLREGFLLKIFVVTKNIPILMWNTWLSFPLL